MLGLPAAYYLQKNQLKFSVDAIRSIDPTWDKMAPGEYMWWPWVFWFRIKERGDGFDDETTDEFTVMDEAKDDIQEEELATEENFVALWIHFVQINSSYLWLKNILKSHLI